MERIYVECGIIVLRFLSEFKKRNGAKMGREKRQLGRC